MYFKNYEKEKNSLSVPLCTLRNFSKIRIVDGYFLRPVYFFEEKVQCPCSQQTAVKLIIVIIYEGEFPFFNKLLYGQSYIFTVSDWNTLC